MFVFSRGYITWLCKLHKTMPRSAFLRGDDVVSVYQDQTWNIMRFGYLGMVPTMKTEKTLKCIIITQAFKEFFVFVF